jgi:hypothetical protein
MRPPGWEIPVLRLPCLLFRASKDYTQHLAAGEVATVAILASDRKQARATFLKTSPLLADFVDDEGEEQVQLRNRVRIEISTATFRGTRGYTYACVICDEIATWRSDESVNPDTEILRAIRPGMLTIPGAMLILASSYLANCGGPTKRILAATILGF